MFVFGGCSEEGIDGPPCGNATVIQVQVRSVEGKTLVVSIGPVVKNPLGDSAHGGETGTSLGHGVPSFLLFLPCSEILSRLGDIVAKPATEIAGQCTKARPDLVVPKESTQFAVARVEQIFAYITEEVEVAAKHRNLPAQFLDEIIDRRDHGLTQIPHHRTGRSVPSWQQRAALGVPRAARQPGRTRR